MERQHMQAWRLWEVEDVAGAPRLRSLYRTSVWPVGEPLVARCEPQRFRLPRRPRHIAPSATCTCGIYGGPFELIRRKLALDERLPPGLPFVVGTVSLWGNVIECERGFRAELAYPSRLFVPLGLPGAVTSAVGLEEYGVPVELLAPLGVTGALDQMAAIAA